MAFENNGNGVLFPVDESKRRTDRSPHYSGNIIINGVEYFISGWKRRAKTSGKPFLSIAVGDKKDQQPSSSNSPPPTNMDDFDDDIPF